MCRTDPTRETCVIDYTDPTQQYDLDQSDHTDPTTQHDLDCEDHMDQGYICPEGSDHLVMI